MRDYLYTYGTLRPGDGCIYGIPGILYDIAWFPGIKLILDGSHTVDQIVVCEKVEVKDWDAVDRYEGYFPDDPASSLYIRREYLDGYIYEFNHTVRDHKIITSGDWLEYKSQRKGINSGHIG